MWEIEGHIHHCPYFKEATNLITFTFLCSLTRSWWRQSTLDISKWADFCLLFGAFSGGISGKETACQCRKRKRLRFDSWVGKMPWRRKWHLIAVFLPAESHGQKSMEGYTVHGVAKNWTQLKQLSTCINTFKVASSHIRLLTFKLMKTEYLRVLSGFSHVRPFVTLWTSPPGSSVHGILQARILVI